MPGLAGALACLWCGRRARSEPDLRGQCPRAPDDAAARRSHRHPVVRPRVIAVVPDAIHPLARRDVMARERDEIDVPRRDPEMSQQRVDRVPGIAGVIPEPDTQPRLGPSLRIAALAHWVSVMPTTITTHIGRAALRRVAVIGSAMYCRAVWDEPSM